MHLLLLGFLKQALELTPEPLRLIAGVFVHIDCLLRRVVFGRFTAAQDDFLLFFHFLLPLFQGLRCRLAVSNLGPFVFWYLPDCGSAVRSPEPVGLHFFHRTPVMR